MRYRSFLACLLCLLILFTGAAAGEEASNLLKNPGFEQLDRDGLPSGWVFSAYRNQDGYSLFDVSPDAYAGEVAAVVHNLASNDARFEQTVRVEPESIYCLSGWIRAEDIPDSGHGANLSIAGVYVFSEGVYESGDWRYIELYGETGEDQTEVTVYARVGGYSGESTGKAYFDDLSLRKVDKLPGDAIASLWFQPDEPLVAVDPVDWDEEYDAENAPFWPWLIVLSCVFLFGLMAAMPSMSKVQPDLREKRGAPAFLIIGMILAAVVRLVVGITVEGYQVDVGCFTAWGNTMASVGPVRFYEASGFCDYPPAYVYALGLSSMVADWLSLANRAFAYKLIPMACDLIAAWLLYRFARQEGVKRHAAGLLGLMTAWNPAFIINSAAWCQMDAVLCLGLMLVAVLAIRRRWMWVMPVYVLCILIKPQALMLGFLGLAAIVLEWLRTPAVRRDMIKGVGLAVAVAAVILIPFSLKQEWNWLFTLYGKTLASYPYATVNTANYYYLFNGNWSAISADAARLAPVGLSILCGIWCGVLALRMNRAQKYCWAEPAIMAVFSIAFMVMAVLNASWGAMGTAAMVLAFLIVLPMYLRAGDLKVLPLLGGVLFLLLYVFGVKMHERYLFPALLFFGMAYVLHRDWRVLVLLGVVSCTMFINEGIVLDNSLRLGSSMGHLNQDTNGLALLLSGINVVSAVFSVWLAHRTCVERAEVPAYVPPKPVLPVHQLPEKPGSPLRFRTDASLHWKRIDWVLMLSVTLVYSVVALCNLGSTKAPQNPWKSTAVNETVLFDLGQYYEDFTMLYFGQVSYEDFSVATSDVGAQWTDEHWAEMAQGQCFRWKYVSNYTESGDTRYYNSQFPTHFSGRYVRLTARQVGLILNEVIFRDADGNRIDVAGVSALNANGASPLFSDPAALIDEQDTLTGEPSWYNSTYFDEIYHARTAFEHLHHDAPYETTHPPLGKVLMSWSVAIFGMTPFGWRFAGALAGILMLPAMYLLGKQLTKRTDMAFAAMTMLALDCMHFTQTRIATIDSFPVLFILLSYLFMLRFMQKDVVLLPMKKLLPDLALSGFFMGCGVASKWIGVYAGIGLAVLFFWTLLRHIRMGCLAEQVAKQDETLRIRALLRWKRPMDLCLWCLLFFIAVPVAVYALSYVPYFSYAKIDGLADFIARVIRAQENMLDYHATPGLGMDHPFHSPWYEWPLITRPMYYADSSFVPEGMNYAIFCFGNPAVWIVGLAGVGCTLAMWLMRKRYAAPELAGQYHWQSASFDVAPAFVLLGLLAQFLPWVLVPRGTYIYHYFASVPFLCLGTMLLLHWLSIRYPRAGKCVTCVYLALCLVCFIAFYPYASGVLVPEGWLDFMSNFLRLYY